MLAGMMPGLGMGEESEEEEGGIPVRTTNKNGQFEDVKARVTKYYFSQDYVLDKGDFEKGSECLVWYLRKF